jgi:hypothetical protein
LPEVVGEGGETGVLVEPGSATALADGIRSVLDSTPEQRARMGKAGRQRVLKHFSWRGTATRTVECYRELVAERRHERGQGHSAFSMPPTVAQTTASPEQILAGGADSVVGGDGLAANGNGNSNSHAANGNGHAANGNGHASNGNGVRKVATPDTESSVRADDRA